jgi:hypothetical protein
MPPLRPTRHVDGAAGHDGEQGAGRQATRLELDQHVEVDAVKLFAQRARAVKPSFTL